MKFAYFALLKKRQQSDKEKNKLWQWFYQMFLEKKISFAVIVEQESSHIAGLNI